MILKEGTRVRVNTAPGFKYQGKITRIAGQDFWIKDERSGHSTLIIYHNAANIEILDEVSE